MSSSNEVAKQETGRTVERISRPVQSTSCEMKDREIWKYAKNWSGLGRSRASSTEKTT